MAGVTSVLHTDAFLLGSAVSDLLTQDDNHGIISFGPGGAEIKEQDQILFTTRRINEKSNLQVLNNRFAMYTRKVRSLEDQNAALLIELAKFENKVDLDWDEIYAPKIEAARRGVTIEATFRDSVVCQRDQYQSQAQLFQAKYEQQLLRYQELLAMKSTINCSSSTLEASMKSEISIKEEELKTTRSAFKTEIADLRLKVKNSGEIHVIQCCEDNDIQVELDRMRNYYESLNQKMCVDFVSKKQTKVVQEKVAVVDNSAEIESVSVEISSLSTRVSILKMELQQLTNTNASLTTKQSENQAEYKAEYAIKELQCVAGETDYKNLKLAMVAQLRKYAELMNTKIGLDMEIATYRKLVDSETKKMDRYDDAISFDNLHKFYAYSAEKDSTSKVVNFTETQFRRLEKDASQIKLKETVRPMNINTTRLGTNPYYSGKLDFSDLNLNSAKYESTVVSETKSW